MVELKTDKEAVTLTFYASLALAAAYHIWDINALKKRRYTSGWTILVAVLSSQTRAHKKRAHPEG